jgi:hypothetical protein
VTTLNVSNNDLRIGVEQPEEIMDTELDHVELFCVHPWNSFSTEIDWQGALAAAPRQGSITFVAALAGALKSNK